MGPTQGSTVLCVSWVLPLWLAGPPASARPYRPPTQPPPALHCRHHHRAEASSIGAATDAAAAEYSEGRQQLADLADTVRAAVLLPERCLHFLRPGRIVRVTEGEQIDGWLGGQGEVQGRGCLVALCGVSPSPLNSLHPSTHPSTSLLPPTSHFHPPLHPHHFRPPSQPPTSLLPTAPSPIRLTTSAHLTHPHHFRPLHRPAPVGLRRGGVCATPGCPGPAGRGRKRSGGISGRHPAVCVGQADSHSCPRDPPQWPARGGDAAAGGDRAAAAVGAGGGGCRDAGGWVGERRVGKRWVKYG